MKSSAKKTKYIWVISDGSGSTAERVLQASLVQFGHEDVEVERIPDVRTSEQIRKIVNTAAKKKGLLAYTLVTPQLRKEIATRANECNIPTVDLLGPLLTTLTTFLAAPPESKPGLLGELDHYYFKRIDAVGFTVKHDDGRGLHDLRKADAVIIGVSRTSKTPLSMYLAYNKGFLVANIPIILGMDPPSELFRVDQKRIVGLTINPDLLVSLRQTRLAQLAHVDINYGDEKHVIEELKYSHQIFRKNPKWSVINITGKAIEEMANELCSLIISKST
ncbi:MAG: kinase/pyrophosphorylase [candidate division Zixibacteria bacterium]|nr:kinase/pyrophosphorylase [candidate division Zixibacteria bacterium]